MRRIYSLALILCLLSITTFSQEKYRIVRNEGYEEKYEQMTLGIGAGFDYGGFGGNLTYYPQKNLGVFFGGGYVVAGFGYNAGLKYRFLPKNFRSEFAPFLIGMYGYYSAVHVSGYNQFDKIFYGPTAGVGFDVGSHIIGKGVFSFALLVPFRNSETNDYINELEGSSIQFKNKPWPIGLSLGYKFNLF